LQRKCLLLTQSGHPILPATDHLQFSALNCAGAEAETLFWIEYRVRSAHFFDQRERFCCRRAGDAEAKRLPQRYDISAVP